MNYSPDSIARLECLGRNQHFREVRILKHVNNTTSTFRISPLTRYRRLLLAITGAAVVLLFLLWVVSLIHPPAPAEPAQNKVSVDSQINSLSRDNQVFSQYYLLKKHPIEPNNPGYTLPLELDRIANYDNNTRYFLKLDAAIDQVLQFGFTVRELDMGDYNPGRNDLFKPYRYFESFSIPSFITTDTFLHLYHLLFRHTLAEIEQRELIPDLSALTDALLDYTLGQYESSSGELREAAKRNIAFLAVGQRLMNDSASIPTLVKDMVVKELSKINAHQGFGSSDIFIYAEDYSQYKPRGHYTDSTQLKKYFKTIKWYSRMGFLLEGSASWGGSGTALISIEDAKIQTKQAVLLALALKHTQVGLRSGMDIWGKIYDVSSFFVGFADDLTPDNYLFAAEQVYGPGFNPAALSNDRKLQSLKSKLALLPSPKIWGGTGNIVVTSRPNEDTLDEMLEKTKGMRLLGERYVPDSWFFQQFVFPGTGSYYGKGDLPFTVANNGAGGLCRGYVRGLDVMAVLGSQLAWEILERDGDTAYVHYEQRYREVRKMIGSLKESDWSRNLYWAWLYTLQSLLEESRDGYPRYMRTEAWRKHKLHSALASWTQLRHDTLLYTKQSYGAGAGRRPPPPPGYIEAVPEFWTRLLAMTQMIRRGLGGLNVISQETEQSYIQLEGLLEGMIEIVAKQLTNQVISDEDGEFIKRIPWEIEHVIRGLIPERGDAPLVADVHTNTMEGRVVQEAVGKVDVIVVACPLGADQAFLAAGPVFSYYEFKQDMRERLTNEEWVNLLESPDKPDRPQWYAPLMAKNP